MGYFYVWQYYIHGGIIILISIISNHIISYHIEKIIINVYFHLFPIIQDLTINKFKNRQ